MAIIGNLYSIEELLKDKELTIVFSYLREAAKIGSEIHQRIFSLPIGSFERVQLTEDIFALEQVYNTKNRDECFIESHLKYIDFQLQLSGEEQMETIDKNFLTVKNKYDKDKDLIIYEANDDMSKIVMKQNSLSIYFPEDAHMGLPRYNGIESLIYKTVVKLPIEQY
ncbi:YhcH/YjgK/YiaL family protein [Reichenbachiella faecimaris]|uniref:YhcH/YjgK/YiaL family protein n=1 Tax=Reichenbachiella faecimaris TaxID=692418 RepID=A0A1W2GCD3_REIFA|nr:YhcH/YjgK/YiaL family protein [Reichenbachiella faecimaris]SMD34330.1 YhcH/YjgK/YiaL family protein [Reichenbachiella faecimaris]